MFPEVVKSNTSSVQGRSVFTADCCYIERLVVSTVDKGGRKIELFVIAGTRAKFQMYAEVWATYLCLRAWATLSF